MTATVRQTSSKTARGFSAGVLIPKPIAFYAFMGMMALACCGQGLAQNTMSDKEIRQLLRERVENMRAPGIVVGLIDARGSRIIAYGKTSRSGGADVDGDTLFEIGSVTKVFTGLLLADMASDGEVNLNDPISKYLPPGVKAPSRDGKEIRLLDLATHHSGLPRMPDNFAPKDPDDPYADYSFDKLCAFLSGYKLTRGIGEKYEYSNLAVGLLGSLLARRAGVSYETLAAQRVWRPLGMTSTAITLSPDLQRRFASGYDSELQPVKPWAFDALAGCGAIRSTARDLLKFLSANMGLTPSPLWPVMRRMRQPMAGTGGGDDPRVGIAWHLLNQSGRDIILHTGQTGGYHSFIGFDPAGKTGVVLLANAAAPLDDIAFRLLNAAAGKSSPDAGATAATIHLSKAQLTRFVGQYEMAPGIKFSIRRDGEHLMAQITGQEYYEIFPTSETNFFYKVVDARITFNCDSDGKVRSLTLHQNGDHEAPRISDQPVAEHTAIKLAPETFDRYTGQYQLTPDAVFTIRRDGSRLLAKLTGQSFCQIYPESELEFFYKVVDAQITFVKGADGKITALILHQNGRNLRAEKTH